ncbi:MAG: caspase family protein, partial [Bacteroidaceae bacterium]|nr:caspase family protein [Bacteroidaceae bacterium]
NQLAEAQFTLAELYEKGVLVEQNAQEAKKWKDMAVVSAKRQKENANLSPLGELEGAANANAQKVGTPVQSVLMGPKALKEQEKKAKKEDVKAKKEDAQVKSENQTPKNISPTPAPNTVSPTPAPNNNTPTNIENKSPVIKILFPEDQSKFHEKTLNVKYKLTAYGEEKNTEVIVMVDGMVQKPSTSTSRSVRAAETVEVQLPDHDCVVTLYAKNRYGNSEPSSIRLIKENSLTEMPKLYVVAIGIGDYDDEKLPDLKFTHKDAADFSKAIAKKRGLPYEEVQVKTLCDDEATQGDIFEALSWLKEVSSPSDVCIFYYAGHGYRDEKDRFFFVPYGAHVDKDWECVSAQSFRDKANEIDGKFIVFLDACYSAALLNGSRSAVTDHFLEQLRSAKNGMMLYASSESDTKSKEDPEWQNGAYTHVLVDALNGAAKEDGDEGLSTDKLEKFLYNKVKEITKGTQKPIWICPNGTQRFNLFIYDK